MNDGWDVAYPKGPIVLESGEKSVVFLGFTARVDTGDGSAPPEAKASIREEKGTLRISWSIPGVTRDATGFPRIADLAVGPASEKPHRVYMGFGNVIEGPRAFTFAAHGSRLSTRHVGADYANGLSVVQAVDVVQDSVVCDGERNLFSLHAHHDATFTFVPSSKGSFAKSSNGMFVEARTLPVGRTVDPEKGAAAPTWSQTGNVLKIACDAKAFAYRIRLRFPHELRTLDGVP